MRKVGWLISEAALALLLNITAGLLNRPDAIQASKWGWLLFFLHLTYVVLSSEHVKPIVWRFRQKFGAHVVISYLVAAALGAAVGVVYWKGLGVIYEYLFPSQVSTLTDEPGRSNSRIQFTISPLWTEERKKIVVEQVVHFDSYLTKPGIIKLPEVVPLFNIAEGINANYAWMGPANPPFDQRQIPIGTGALDAFSIRHRYAQYLFDILLSVHSVQSKPEEIGPQFASWIYSEYFTASSLNKLRNADPKRFNGWLSALWEIRREQGQDFADRALMYSVRAPEYVRHGKDWNEYFLDRFRQGVLVVKNDDQQYVAVLKTLERCGLVKPKP